MLCCCMNKVNRKYMHMVIVQIKTTTDLIRCNVGGRTVCKGKNCFIEYDIPRDIDTSRARVKALVPLMKPTVTQEHASFRPEREFVFVIRSQIWPTSAAKYTEHGIIWWSFEETF
jgi:hypothetical protein